MIQCEATVIVRRLKINPQQHWSSIASFIVDPQRCETSQFKKPIIRYMNTNV